MIGSATPNRVSRSSARFFGTVAAFLALSIGAVSFSALHAQQAPASGATTSSRAKGDASHDIAAFAARRTECQNWTGEEGTDPGRAQEVAKAIARLRCDSLDSDERRLRSRYAKDPAAIEALDKATAPED